MIRRQVTFINSSTVFLINPLSASSLLFAPTFSASFRSITGEGRNRNSTGDATSNVLRSTTATTATSTRQRAVPYHHQQKALHQHLEHQFDSNKELSSSSSSSSSESASNNNSNNSSSPSPPSHAIHSRPNVPNNNRKFAAFFQGVGSGRPIDSVSIGDRSSSALPGFRRRRNNPPSSPASAKKTRDEVRSAELGFNQKQHRFISSEESASEKVKQHYQYNDDAEFSSPEEKGSEKKSQQQPDGAATKRNALPSSAACTATAPTEFDDFLITRVLPLARIHRDYFNISTQTIADGRVLWVDIGGVEGLRLADWRIRGYDILNKLDVIPRLFVEECIGPDPLPQSIVIGNNSSSYSARRRNEQGDDDDTNGNNNNNNNNNDASYYSLPRVPPLFRQEGGCDSCLAILRTAFRDPPAGPDLIQTVSTRLCLVIIPSKNLIITVHRRPVGVIRSMLPVANNAVANRFSDQDGSTPSSSSSSSNSATANPISCSKSSVTESLAGKNCEYEARFRKASPSNFINALFKRTCKTYAEEITRCVIKFDALESQLFAAETHLHRSRNNDDQKNNQDQASSSSSSSSVVSRDKNGNILTSIATWFTGKNRVRRFASASSAAARTDLARELYQLKRRAAVYSRILVMISDTYANVVTSTTTMDIPHDPFYQDVDQHNAYTRSLADGLSDNVQNALQLLFQLSSHNMNELMKLLTMLSAFFIPLGFWVSIWSMGFEYLPFADEDSFTAWVSVFALIAVVLGLWLRKKF